MSYDSRWVCKDCGESGHLAFNDVWFAPDVCPGCGAESGWRKSAQFESVTARLAYRPKGLNFLRWRWVTPEGVELGRAALREAGMTDDA